MDEKLPQRSPRDRVGYAVAKADGSPLFYEVTANRRGGRARRGGHVQSAGTVILCDGIGCDGYVWKYLTAALARDFDVVHWHYPGHGRSPSPRDPTRLTIPDLAEDLVAVLDDIGTDSALVFGHSMGVQVSLETYRRHPTRVRALGLLCGAPGTPLKTFRRTNLLERLLPRVRSLVDRAPGITRRLSQALLPTSVSYAIAAQVEVNGHLLDQADFMPYLRGLAEVPPQLFLSMLAGAAEHSAHDLLPHIKVPTVVVAGERDGFTPPELSRQMADAIPNATLISVEEGSHTAPLERPHFVNHGILEFLEASFGPLTLKHVPESS